MWARQTRPSGGLACPVYHLPQRVARIPQAATIGFEHEEKVSPAGTRVLRLQRSDSFYMSAVRLGNLRGRAKLPDSY